MEDKELLKIIVEFENNSLVATVEKVNEEDPLGNFAFGFISFCRSMGLTTKEGLKYLKQGVKLWEKYGEYS